MVCAVIDTGFSIGVLGMIKMNISNWRCCTILTLCLVMALTAASADESGGAGAARVRPPYTLNPGDILSISVWKES